jgi:hypothetical protein
MPARRFCSLRQPSTNFHEQETTMAVVTKYGTGARDAASLLAIDGIKAAAELRTINSLISITNGDSIASKFMIGEVPADAILSPGGTLYYDALTGATDCDVGVAYPNGGTMIVADCIVNGQTLAVAGSVTLAAATGSGVATATNIAKRVWELAGLTSNPGGNLALWLTLNAAATATGKILARLGYDKGA